jgi:hypothetical protein
MNEILITVEELRITSYLFRQESNDDSEYKAFCEGERSVNDIIALLRKWGCRQFTKDDNKRAVQSLNGWLHQNEILLPKENMNLVDTSNKRILSFSDLFDSLMECHTSRSKRFGPVGAAKTLFFLRSRMFPAWDGYINEEQGLSPNGEGYCQFLLRVKDALTKLEKNCSIRNIALKKLPQLLGRKHASLVKLIDEYLYLKVTRGFDPREILKIAKNKKFNNG